MCTFLVGVRYSGLRVEHRSSQIDTGKLFNRLELLTILPQNQLPTHIMKMTVELPDDLLIEAKATAARQRTTLRAIIEHALRREIFFNKQKSRRQKMIALLSVSRVCHIIKRAVDP